jgi:pimeloyl-ACP methyl ester carboxylesterase
MNAARVEVDGVALHVRDYSEGDPIVLLPPGPGLDGSVFFPWFERLDGYRLIAPDLRGHGLSDRGQPGDWTFARWAADVARLAEALELGQYTLLGHSSGARVALQHAVDYPGHAARLICSGGVAHAGASAHLDETFARFGTPELRARVEAAFEAEEAAETPEECHAAWMGQMPFFLADPEGPALRELDRLWRGVRYNPEIHRHGDYGDFDVRERLANVAVPVLVITGREDRISRPQDSEEIARLLPNARLAIVDDAGHFPFAEQPDAYLGELRRWLSAH